MSTTLYTPKAERERRAKDAADGKVVVAWRKKGCSTCKPIVVTARPALPFASPPKP